MQFLEPSASPQDWLQGPLRHLASLDLAHSLSSLLEAWELLSRLWEKLRYQGLYAIIAYDSTLELLDPRGDQAVFTRRERIRFLQDNVVALHDHAWGDGQLFASYRCQPGVPVDIYPDGSRHNVLISLRETKNKGDILELWIERVVHAGFTQDEEWLETEIDHWMEQLHLSIIFPQERPCRRATLSRRSTAKTVALPQDSFALLPDGRQRLAWETAHPKLHDCYTIKWAW